MPRYSPPNIRHPAAHYKQRQHPEAHNRNPPVSYYVYRRALLLERIDDVSALFETVLSRPLQHGERIDEEGSNQYSQPDYNRGSSLEEIDSHGSAVGIIICVLKSAGDDSDDDVHSTEGSLVLNRIMSKNGEDSRIVHGNLERIGGSKDRLVVQDCPDAVYNGDWSKGHGDGIYTKGRCCAG
jgi:hypothetical protein